MRCWSTTAISGAARCLHHRPAPASVGTLIANDINLFAYHLPLDAHLELGNNARSPG